MNATSACPPPGEYARLLSGCLPPESVELLAGHLEHCPTCMDTFRGLNSEDTVVSSLRAAEPPLSDEEARVLEEVIRKLLRRDEADPGATRADAAGDTGTSETSANPSGARAGGYDFLAPPAQPGDLGRLGGLRVLRLIGEGGMGFVFEAEDPHLRRRVAVKAIKPALCANEAARRRFLREARMVAALEHDHVVAVHQVGDERGVSFLIMPLLKGETLDERLRREPVLPLPEALRIGREVAEALSAAHEAGMVHRDVKPNNVWLEGSRARVKVLDFGLARPVEGDSLLTSPHAVAGTPAYMAPEQARGQAVDARSDLFALGSVLYRMCTGKVPFLRPNVPATLFAVTHEQPPPPAALNPAVPAAVSDLVMQLLQKDPGDRPASAREVADRLAALAQPGAGTQPPAPPGAGRARRRAALVALALAVLLPAVYLYGGVVVRFATNRGEVVIRVDDPAAEVTVRERDAVILDRAAVQAITLTPGEHELEVTVRNRDGESHFFTKSFTLRRGGTEVINVRQELARAADRPDDADRRVAARVFAVGGKVGLAPNHDEQISCLKDMPARARVYFVNLTECPATDDLVASLSALTRLQFLRLGVCRQVTDAGVVHLSALTGLRELSLNSTQTTDAGLAGIAGLTEIRELGLADTRITDAGLPRLRSLEKLEALCLAHTRVTDAGLTRLRQFDHLARLDVSGTPITAAGIEQLRALPSLQTLNLGDTRLSKAALSRLQRCEKLTDLYLGVNKWVDDGALEAVKGMTSLQFLYLMRTPVGDAGLNHLKSLTELRLLELSDTSVGDAGLTTVGGLKKVESLSLAGTRVTDAGLEPLRNLTALRDLDLQYTKVTPAGVARLQKELPKCRIIGPAPAK